MSRRRVYLVVALCAFVVYVGALQNRFAWDDTQIIVKSDFVHSWSGIWHAFTQPYWPSTWGGFLYRPLTVATYALDWQLGGAGWFHFVNILWHVLASVLVALLAARWVMPPEAEAQDPAFAGRAALIAGLIFAVHPVHTEAVANIVGRAEEMAAVFAILTVYAAVEKESVLWSAVLWGVGLFSKENAGVAPGLIIAAWILGVGQAMKGRGRPTPRRMATFAASWVVVGCGYAFVRARVLSPWPQALDVAPLFHQIPTLDVRMTGVAALADLLRLLVFPLTLRVDYSPAERTVVTSFADPMFIAGAMAGLCWLVFLVMAWRRGRKEVALGLLWIAMAYAPVANIFFTGGVNMAERTLYLPSVGLALAAAAWLTRLDRRNATIVTALLVVAGGIRSALRVPVWKTDERVMLSILEDSPRSYRGPMSAGIVYLEERLPAKAWDALDTAIAIYPYDGRLYLLKAHAAFDLGRSDQVESILVPVKRACLPKCAADFLGDEVVMALAMGDKDVSDSLAALKRRTAKP